MNPIILIDGIKSTSRHDTALAVARHLSCDLYVGNVRTEPIEYLNWLDISQMSGVVIESSWQTQRIAKLIAPSASCYEAEHARLLDELARKHGAITVHVTCFVETVILSASMDQHTGSLNTMQLDLLFRTIREWEFPEFKVRPVIEFNPHVTDFNESLFPEIDATMRELAR